MGHLVRLSFRILTAHLKMNILPRTKILGIMVLLCFVVLIKRRCRLHLGHLMMRKDWYLSIFA